MIQLGGYLVNPNRPNPQRGRVYDMHGIAPCLGACMGEGGNLVPVIVMKYESD